MMCLKRGCWIYIQPNQLHRIPTPSSILKDILHLAKYVLCLEPQICFNLMLSSIPDDHLVAWRSLTPSDFCKIYEDQTTSAEKVIQSLTPDITILNSQQEKVIYFLKTFIREAASDLDLIHKFVRFVTGSNNLLVSQINVTFHNGFQFPKAMTCGHTLILSTSYCDYFTFKKDFSSILENEDSFLMLSS